jgi:hypothetical protein
LLSIVRLPCPVPRGLRSWGRRIRLAAGNTAHFSLRLGDLFVPIAVFVWHLPALLGQSVSLYDASCQICVNRCVCWAVRAFLQENPDLVSFSDNFAEKSQFREAREKTRWWTRPKVASGSPQGWFMGRLLCRWSREGCFCYPPWSRRSSRASR